MSKRKKIQPSKQAAPFPRRISSSIPQTVLDRIHSRMDYDDLEPLHAELLRLEKQEPHDGRVLALLIDSSETLGDLQSLERTSVKYYRLLPDMPDAVLTLAEAYALNTKPILALKTYQRFLERWPDRTEVPTVLKKIEDLRPIVESMLKQYREITTEELDLASKHEEMQSLTAMGEVSQARHIGNALLKKYPTFAPALNNIAYSFAYEGNYREAIAAALRVLEFEPDNVHALANLIRYYSFMGERDRALPLGERLKTSQAPASLRTRKIMETLFLVHDFAGVLEAFERDLKDSEEDATNPDLMHLAATAACYLGQKDEAKRLWLNTLEQMPDHSLAKDNLADVDLPEGESHGPFAFRSAYWFDGRLLEAMLDTANQVDAISEEASQRAYRKLIRQHPEVVSIASLIFELGDPVTTQLMISLVHASAAPELAESMRKFAGGHRGSDQMRLKALSFAHSESDETTAPVAFWAQGQETEVTLRGYEIYEDAYTDTDAIPAMLPHVYELYEASINLSNDGEFHQAELLINRALTFEPDNPRLRNNLAAVLGAQGRHTEASAQIEEIHIRNPDYFFGRCNLATYRAHNGRLAEAKALLEPIETIKRLHITEYTALCTAEITYYLASKEIKAAEIWGTMLEQIDPDHPGLKQLKRHQELEEFEAFKESIQKLTKRRRRNR